jgi:hypothetical protein
MNHDRKFDAILLFLHANLCPGELRARRSALVS